MFPLVAVIRARDVVIVISAGAAVECNNIAAVMVSQCRLTEYSV